MFDDLAKGSVEIDKLSLLHMLGGLSRVPRSKLRGVGTDHSSQPVSSKFLR